MARFVTTDEGWVNLDHVSKVKLLLYGSDGRVIGKAEIDAERLPAPVIPAAPGTVAICLYPSAGVWGGRPEEVHVSERVVLGWRLTSTPTPILIEEPASTAHVLIHNPDGSMTGPDFCTFRNLDDAKDYVLSTAQERWDRTQAQLSELFDDIPF